jgi:hypothetical protein
MHKSRIQLPSARLVKGRSALGRLRLIRGVESSEMIDRWPVGPRALAGLAAAVMLASVVQAQEHQAIRVEANIIPSERSND